MTDHLPKSHRRVSGGAWLSGQSPIALWPSLGISKARIFTGPRRMSSATTRDIPFSSSRSHSSEDGHGKIFERRLIVTDIGMLSSSMNRGATDSRSQSESVRDTRPCGQDTTRILSGLDSRVARPPAIPGVTPKQQGGTK